MTVWIVLVITRIGDTEIQRIFSSYTEAMLCAEFKIKETGLDHFVRGSFEVWKNQIELEPHK